jgi:anti-sigma B factor antagonist
VLTEFRIEVRHYPDAAVLAPVGELDLTSAGKLEGAIAEALDGDDATIVLDLRQVSFMDSSGLRALLAGSERCERAGIRFGIVRGPDQVQRLLSVTHVAERLTLVDDPEQLIGGG